ncbi:hypothetical protein [Asinibacterium sp. OR53]|uniref:hypothetical protein n=1 Tax=Asinibacterium sp. OR53 TaxID=925409 RepID=UPI0004791EB8|nr:hypothetical protein [Asinibacterium sp. OR53]
MTRKKRLTPNVAKVLKMAKEVNCTSEQKGASKPANATRKKPKTRDYSCVFKNPLADYIDQIEPNLADFNAPLSDSTLSQFQYTLGKGVINEGSVKYTREMPNYEFTKVINSAKNRNTILNLSDSAVRLFVYILYEIEHLNDTIDLEYEQVQKKGLGIKSRDTYRKAIDKLSEAKVIKRIGKKPKGVDYHLFHFNPQMLFCGEAKNFYRGVIEAHPEYSGFPLENFSQGSQEEVKE